MISNLRFPTVFVLQNINELQLGDNTIANNAQPRDLTAGQVGFYDVEYGRLMDVANTSAARAITIHQNIGDADFGTIRTKNIHLDRVRGWRKQSATTETLQVTYIGYDESDANKKICTPCGDDQVVVITVYEKDSIGRYYNPVGLTYRLTIPTHCCDANNASSTYAQADAWADALVAQINGTDGNAYDFPTNRELKNYITAAKVTTGGTSVGVKLTAISRGIDLLNKCQPEQQHVPAFVHFTVSWESKNCKGCTTPTPVTYTTKGKPGSGFPLEIATLEKESQGYSRVRDHFSETRYMKPDYILRSQDGVKYDTYYLDFEYAHTKMGVQNGGKIEEPYTVIFAVPTGTGAPLEGFLKNLINKYPTSGPIGVVN